MELQINDEDEAFARKFFSDYNRKPGSERIASEFAIAHLSALLRQIKPASVIEHGAGIGTMTHALLAHPANIAEVITTENNDFCLQQLAVNIPAELSDRLQVVSNPDDLKPLIKQCDLVIFDGGSVSNDELAFIGKGSVCFIEGSRSYTTNKINEKLKKDGLICHFKNYHQGYRYFALSWYTHPMTGKKKRKFRFRKLRKGFKLGQVVPL